MRAAASRQAILVALLVLLQPGLLLAGAQMPGAAVAPGPLVVAPLPAHFSQNASLDVSIHVRGLVAAASGEPFTLVHIILPEGGAISRAPTPPENWSLTSYDFGARPPWLEYAPLLPGVHDEAVFPMRVDALPCPTGNDGLAWTVRAQRSVSATQLVTAGDHRCDKRPPVLVSLGPASVGSEDGTVPLATVTDDSPLALTAHVTLPNGTTVTHRSEASPLVAPIERNATGEWRYHVEAQDAAGNLARFPASGSASLLVRDATPPLLELSAPGPQEAGVAPVVFHNATDNHQLASLELWWREADGATSKRSVLGTSSSPLPAVSDWQRVVELGIVALDAAGNRAEAYANLTFTDTVAPTTSIVAPEPDARGWHPAAIDLRVGAADAGSPRVVVNHSLYAALPDGTSTVTHGNSSPPLDLRLEGPARYTLHWAARDDKGNVAPTQRRAFDVDPQAPQGWFENVTDGWQTRQVDVTFRTLAPLSGLAGSAWRVGGVEQSSPTRAFFEGVHALSWNATSRAGHEATGSATLRIDLTPPVLALTNASTGDAATGRFRGDVTLTATASDATSGIASLTRSLDGAPPQPYTAPVVVPAEGAHTFEVVARDAAGLETVRRHSFVIDRTAPTLRVLANGSESAGPHNDSATLTVQVLDASATLVSCSLDNQTVTFPIVVATEGAHFASCSARDASGNDAQPASLRFLVDRNPPALDALGALGPLRTLSASFAIRDTSALALVEGRWQSGSQSRPATLAQDASGAWRPGLSGVPDGAHVLFVRAVDQHGRSSGWVEVLSLTLVTRGPAADLRVPPAPEGGFTAPVSISWTLADHPVAADMRVRVGEGEETVVSSPYVVTAEGVTNLTFRTRDALGNRGDAQPVSVRIVPPPPPAPEPEPPTPTPSPTPAPTPTPTPSTPTPTPTSTPTPTPSPTPTSTPTPTPTTAPTPEPTPDPTPDPGAQPHAGRPGNRPPRVESVRVAFEGAYAIAIPGAVSDPDGDSVQLYYRWRLDGRDAPGNGASQRVLPGQRIHVALTPWDGDAFGATVTTEAVVPTGAPETPAPVPRIHAAAEALAGEPVVFDATGSRHAVSWAWTFSDGASAEGARVEHAFAQAGPAWAELTIASATGASATLRHALRIVEPDAPRLVEEAAAFTHVAQDGRVFTLTGRDVTGLALARELPGTAFLLRQDDALLLWRPIQGSVEEVVPAAGATGSGRLVHGAQLLPVTFQLPPSGWALVRAHDPQPGLVLTAILEAGGAPAAWWREGETIHVLTRSPGLELRYALPPLVARGAATETSPGQWRIAYAAEGGGPLASLQIIEGDAVIAQSASRAAETTYVAKEPRVVLRVLARSADGQEAVHDLVLQSTPAPRETVQEGPVGGERLEVPLPILALGLAALGAAAMLLRRRR